MTRPHYNRTIKHTHEEELLLNLVRLRYDDAPFFLSLDAVTAQFTADQRIGVNAEADAKVARYFGNGDLSFADSPTLSYTPQDSADFIRSMLTPIDVESLALLARLGWNNERVFRLIIRRINGVDNASSAGGPVAELAPEYTAFRQIAYLANRLREQQLSDITVEERPLVVTTASGIDKPSGDQVVRAAESGLSIDAQQDDVMVSKLERQLVARFNPQSILAPEVQQFRQLLRLRPDLLEYPIVPASEGHFDALNTVEGMDEIRINTRAPLEILFFLSKGVIVPPEHYECGLAAMTHNVDGSPFNWLDVVGDLMTVHVCDTKPKARLAVKYRGYWYYIADTDLRSRRTLMMLIAILDLSRVESRGERPVLTLPI